MSVNAANLFGVGWIETECGLREAGPKILCPLVSFRERQQWKCLMRTLETPKQDNA